jgi:hypothetical protein
VVFATGLFGHLIVHDLFAGTNVLIVDSLNNFCCGTLSNPSLSADGRLVAYDARTFTSSFAHELRVRDLLNGQTDSVATLPSAILLTGPVLSSDGRYVVFASVANNLVANDANVMNDVFVRDRLLGVTMPVSANAQGHTGNSSSTRPVFAADGRTVVFQSFSSDLAGGDYNEKRDVFVLKLGGADTDGDGMDDDWEVAYFGNLSRNGTGDFDGDGVSDLAEFRAGTDPTNSNSVFRVLTVAPMGGGSTLVMWTGNSSRSYRVEFKDDLGAANWTALTGTISWNGTTASITDTTASGSTHRYYHVVRLP